MHKRSKKNKKKTYFGLHSTNEVDKDYLEATSRHVKSAAKKEIKLSEIDEKKVIDDSRIDRYAGNVKQFSKQVHKKQWSDAFGKVIDEDDKKDSTKLSFIEKFKQYFKSKSKYKKLNKKEDSSDSSAELGRLADESSMFKGEKDVEDIDISESSTDIILKIPSIDENREPTKRELALAEEKLVYYNKQKKYVKFCKLYYKNVSYLLCFVIITVCGHYYPFNVYEELLERELGIIPANIAFLGSTGVSSFFIIGGVYSVIYDYYGVSWGIIFGSILIVIGSFTLSGAFQHYWSIEFYKLCIYYTVEASGYGMIYVSCFDVIVKSVSMRHRGKIVGFVNGLFLMGSYYTYYVNKLLYFILIENNSTKINILNEIEEGKIIMFKTIWMTVVFILGAFFIREIKSKWYMHRDYDNKLYFKSFYNKHYTLKNYKSIQFILVCLFGSLMYSSCYLYPSLIVIILDSFRERKYNLIYKQTISFISSLSCIICGILIDLIKYWKRPGLFALLSVVLQLLCNLILIFNMYDWLLFAGFLNATGLGFLWSSFPVMLCDLYGTNNFGRNLGTSFIIGGLICGYLLTGAGEWYTQTIHDGGVRCYGEECFRQVFIYNLALILLSFVCLTIIPKRKKENRDNRFKGVIDVKYFDKKSEQDFVASKKQNIKIKQAQIFDEWIDNKIYYADDLAAEQFNQSDMEYESSHESNKESEWSSNDSGIIYADDIAKQAFSEKLNKKSIDETTEEKINDKKDESDLLLQYQ